jgi:hypothetical protein
MGGTARPLARLQNVAARPSGAAGSFPAASLDELINRVAKSRMEAAVQGVVRAAPDHMLAAPQRALEALGAEGSSGSLRMVEDMLDTHGMALGEPLGAGMESLVFAAEPLSGQGRHVLKVAVDLPRPHGEPFVSVDGVPGVAPYAARERFGNVLAALQPRAAVVMPRDMGADPYGVRVQRWNEIARRVADSLNQRGHVWTDAIPQNMGLMDDGNWSVIDGALLSRPPSSTSTEDAIRMLRLTPQDEALLRRTVPGYGQ